MQTWFYMLPIHQTMIHQFIDFLTIDRGLKKNSIHAYCQDVILFLTDTTIENLSTITQEDILFFIEQRTKNNEAETTIARRLISLKIFFKFLQETHVLSRDLFINHPKIWKRLPSILTEDEVSKLLACPLNSSTIQPYIACRDTAILFTLYSTGIRVSELCGLHIYDINDDFIRVTGKGSKTRLIPLGKQAQTTIDQYLCSYRDAFQNKYPEENHLFLSVKGKKLERSCVWRRVQYYAKQITHKQVSPHSLRHAFATHLLNNQADLRIIQEMLGHARISSTEIYTHVAFNSVIEKFLNYHPRNL